MTAAAAKKRCNGPGAAVDLQGVNSTSASEAESWLSRDEEWTHHHQAHIDGWLEGQQAASADADDVRGFAARTLIGIPAKRVVGRTPDEPDREPYTWDEIDAYEVLFQQVVYGGHPFVEAEAYLHFMGEFADYLGQLGVIAGAEHAALVADWEVWSSRVLEVWTQGGWYLRDGTHLPPDGLERRNSGRGKPPEQRTRFGRFRRRTRPVRRR